MEFVMQTDLSTALPKTIDFNYEAQKAWLAERLAYYNGLVVTEDAIKDAKADRANLNKLKEALTARRREVKKEVLAPYTSFETKVNELIALVDQPIVAIDSQLKAFDDARREEKRQKICALYDVLVDATIRDIIPLDRIFDQKWLNATVNMKKIEDDLAAIIKRVNADLIALDTVPPEYATAVRGRYIATLDIAAALAHQKSLQEAAEAFRAREEAKAAQEPTAPVAPTEPAVEPARQPAAAQAEQDETLYALTLHFQLTKEQAGKLRRFLDDNHITYEKIQLR